MTKSEFVSEMKNQIAALTEERKELLAKYKSTNNDDLYYKASKIGHEISALENAVRELER